MSSKNSLSPDRILPLSQEQDLYSEGKVCKERVLGGHNANQQQPQEVCRQTSGEGHFFRFQQGARLGEAWEDDDEEGVVP